MKKLITLILVLTGMVSTASAKTATVYVKAGSCPNIHIWNTGDGGTSTTWGTSGESLPPMTETNLYGVTVYKYDVTYYTDSFNCLFKGSETKSSDITGITGTAYYKWDGTNSAATAYDPSISQVEIRGDFNDWGETVMTEDEGTYSSTIDLTNTWSDQKFKIVVKNKSGDYGWLGWNANTWDKTDTGSLLSPENDGTKWDNIVINNDNMTYKKYDVSVSFTNPTEWSLTFAGSVARGKQNYTINLKNDAGWSSVYAHVYNSTTLFNHTGNWPGAEMTDDNSDGIYSYTLTDAYEPYPDIVIFSQNGSPQTVNLALTDGCTYSNSPTTYYYVVGETALFGDWDQSKNAAKMTFVENGDQDYYKFEAENAVFSENASFKIVKKVYYGDCLYSNDWYPSNDREITIPEAGKYNVSVIFNSYWNDWTNNGVASGTATLVSIPATTVGGYGTFSSATHDLDFSSASLTAYTATSAADGLVHMEPVTGKVPAATGLFLVGATEYIPVTTDASSVGTNLLHPTTGGDIYNSSKFQYVLGNQSGIAFYKVGGSLSPAAGKAYLETDAAAATNARLAFIFDDDENTTGIVNNKREVTAIDGYYNLNGQRVANPTKGLYIVNGKKVIIK